MNDLIVYFIGPMYCDAILITFKCCDCDKTLEARLDSKWLWKKEQQQMEVLPAEWFVEHHSTCRAVVLEELLAHPRVKSFVDSVSLPLEDLDGWWRCYLMNYYKPQWKTKRRAHLYNEITEDLNPVHPLLSDAETEHS